MSCMQITMVTIYLEGNTSQSECLEISLGSLHRAEDEAFFTGTDVVLPVAVEWTNTEGKRRSIVVRTALLQHRYVYVSFRDQGNKRSIMLTCGQLWADHFHTVIFSPNCFVCGACKWHH